MFKSDISGPEYRVFALLLLHNVIMKEQNNILGKVQHCDDIDKRNAIIPW